MKQAIAVAWMVLFALGAAPAPAAAQTEHEHMFLGSTEEGQGQLTLDFDFNRVLPVTPTFCSGGSCLFISSSPAFNSAGETQPAKPFYTLPDGVPVSMEIVAIDAGMSVKYGSHVYTDPRQSIPPGTTPGHFHPSWQVTADTGHVADYDISFKVTTTAPQFTISEVFSLTFTNATPGGTPTATYTATSPPSTRTPTASPSGTTATPTSPSMTPTAPPSSTPTTRRATPVPTATRTPTNSAEATPTAEPTPAADANCDARVTAADLPAAILAGGGAACVAQPRNREAVLRAVVDGIFLAGLADTLASRDGLGAKSR